MIIDAIINFAYFLIQTFIGFFPSSTGLPDEVHTAASAIGGYFGIWDPVLPLDTLATCVGLIISVELGIFGFKTFKWIISHVPWIGGKGV